ncbi:flagellar biosynthesis protein FlhF [Oceanobacillus halotolerans]|uniref:flagellar biosynthesis protein FlhF n=1 Tax=Oceanobacillus halotolerans TaxID=2663380 RepID=UPI0013D93E7B|nr:flagellar biosynthesis protein FlhF [Oceanobacillus halotolerans]
MKVKKFIAPTMPEAMNQVRKELGKEAVILNSKEVYKGGFLGFFKKRNIEVIAALDPQPKAPKQIKTKQKNIDDKKPLKPKESTDQDILNELKQLKKLVSTQSMQLDNTYKPVYQTAFQYLIDQEVEEGLVKEIIDEVMKTFEEKEMEPEQSMVFSETKKEMERKLETVTFEGITMEKKVIHFVGPTGVGKTTTIAKIAAMHMLSKKKKVAFITADTYRIAAIEQLKTYARILDVPLEVAYDLDGYKTAIESFSDYDLILVDTAGRNFRDKKFVHELKSNIDFNDDIETYLVLSLTAKAKDIQEIYEQFHHIPIKELIFTKIDETTQYGSIFTTALKNNIGVAYITNGQDVPDDLIEPSPSYISNLIMEAYRDA